MYLFHHYSNIKLEQQLQIRVYYDAWGNDNDEDPVLSLVYNIIKSLNINYSLKGDIKFLDLGADILELFSGKKIDKVIETLRGNDPLSKLKSEKNIHKSIKDFLDSVMCERGNRLLIFIDELDRCKPEYAVNLLERVKHYFDNDRITFVFSTNIKELQHTISRYYGYRFNSCKYLDRFFDLRVSMPKPDYKRFYDSIDLYSSPYTFDLVCDAVIKVYHFELREIAKFVKIAKIATYEVTHTYNSYLSEKVIFCISYIYR